MRKGVFAVFAAVVLLHASPGRSPAQEAPKAFEFYGLRFGMDRDQVREAMPSWSEKVATDPGHGMTSLFLDFDQPGKLMQIRAVYEAPQDPLKAEGLKRALGEKFVVPTKSAYPSVYVLLDEYAARGSFTLTFLSKTIKELNIEGYKKEFLETLE